MTLLDTALTDIGRELADDKGIDEENFALSPRLFDLDSDNNPISDSITAVFAVFAAISEIVIFRSIASWLRLRDSPDIMAYPGNLLFAVALVVAEKEEEDEEEEEEEDDLAF